MAIRPIANTRSVTGIPTGRLAVWWVIGSEIVIFGGLLMSYLMFRLAHGEWSAHSANTNTTIGAFNTLVLLTSSLTAVLGHKAAEEGDGKKAANMLYLTCLGGAIFAGVKAYEWSYEISHGFTLLTNSFWGFYYTAAGLHALHVIAGCIVMLIVAAKAKKNIDLHHVELIGLYWHFVDLVWIFLFPLLYIAK